MSEVSGLRVLLVSSATLGAEDAGRHVGDLLRRLPAAGIEAGLACPRSSDLAGIAVALGIPVFEVDPTASFAPSRLASMSHALLAFEPGIVHAHGWRAGILARVADSRARRRVIYHIHNMYAEQAPTATRRAAFLRVQRRLRGRTAAWVTTCGSDLNRAEDLKIVERERSHVIHHGVDLPAAVAGDGSVPGGSGHFRAELGMDATSPLVVAIGSYDERTDQRMLLGAWAGVRAASPDAVLALVGSGELEGRLRVRAVALGLGDSVRFVPARSDLAPVYADADLVAFSSRSAGLPYTLLDAMAWGRAVVSTAVDGVPELVMNEDTGLLVPPHDSESMAAAIRRLLRDAEARAAMAASGRERVERHFALDTMVDGVLRVYDEVASG